MSDWLQEHKASIQFVIWTIVGLVFIAIGIFNGREPAMIALGAGALGLPGFSALSRDGR